MSELDQIVAANAQWQREDTKQRMFDPFGPTSSIQIQEADKAASAREYKTSLVGDAFRAGNIGNGLYNMIERKLTYAPDENFRLSDHFDQLTAGLSTEYWDEFSGVRSLEEGQALRAQIDREIQAQNHLAEEGVLGAGAMLLAGVIDVDLPLMFFSGGESIAAKFGLQGTKMGKWFARGARARKIFGGVASGAARFGAEGAAFATADALVHPTSSFAYLPKMVLSNSIMGGGLRGLSRTMRRANESIVHSMEDFEDMFHDRRIGMDRIFNPAAAEHSVFTAGREAMSAAADAFVRTLPTTISNSRLAMRFNKFLQESPLATDWDRLWRSGSNIAKVVAYECFESAAGIVRNNRTAAMLKNMYESRISNLVINEHAQAYKRWAGEQPGARFMDIYWDNKLKDQFDRLVHEEMQTRMHTGVGSPNVHPAVKRAADAADAAGASAIRIAIGHAGEKAVAGFETLKAKSGYVPLIWHGRRIMDAVNKYGHTRVFNLLKDGYRKVFPDLDEETLGALASAIIRRGRGKAKDMDMNLMNLLTADGRSFLREALEENGISSARAEQIVKGLGGDIEERGISSRAKSRTNIDLRTTDGELSLFDLIETDHIKLWSRYARDISGRAALARKGITNKAQLAELFDKILEEDALTGGKLTRRELEDMFTHFDSGPISGGVSAPLRRMIQLTNLSLLNQMGLTQLAETGPMIAAVGWENFVNHSPLMRKIMRRASAGHTDELLDEFEALTGKIGDEHNLFRDDLAMDYARTDLNYQSVILQTLDKALAKGQRLQGFLSGFNSIRKIQQRIAVAGMTDKCMKMLRAGDFEKGMRRLEDIGLDADTLRKLKSKYVDSGIVEFDDRGLTQRLNLDRWDIKDAEDFTLAINRFTNQVVQRAMAGETTAWMHKDLGKLFTHLQQFPLLAMEKQVIRNARIMDSAAAMTFIYGLGTAGLAYTAKQLINGRTDRLDPKDVALGAFGMSNMTGWIPMWTDPLAAMLGMDDLRFNHYGPRVGAPILSAPAIPTMQKMVTIPGALAHIAAGNADAGDIAAVKMIPILGNAYGFSMMFDAMRD